MSDDMRARPAGPGSREPSPDGLGPSGFDPSRFTNAKFAYVTGLLLNVVARQSQALATGMWNPHFCAKDASADALAMFDSLADEIDHWRAFIRDSDGSGVAGETAGLDPKGDSADPQGIAQTAPSPNPHGDNS